MSLKKHRLFEMHAHKLAFSQVNTFSNIIILHTYCILNMTMKLKLKPYTRTARAHSNFYETIFNLYFLIINIAKIFMKIFSQQTRAIFLSHPKWLYES